MEEERQEGGVSLSEILFLIWKRIIWILAISVAAALICGLVAMFAVSPSKENYQLSFVIDYPNQFGEDSTEKLQYPDGTIFRFETAVYAENLEKAKNSDEAFQSIDTKKMSTSGDIVVSASALSDVAGRYTVTVSSKYFKNAEQATKFLKAICSETKKTIVEKVKGINYSTGLSGYDSVAILEQKLEILENQHLSVLAQYENYLDLYAKFSYNGKTLDNYYSDATVFFNRKDLADVQIIMKENDKEYHLKAYEALKEKAEALDQGSTIFNKLTAKMTEHLEKSAKLDLEVSQLKEALAGREEDYTPPASDKLEEELGTLYAAVVAETQVCGEVVTALYEANTVFNYEQSVVVKTGGVSAVKYALVAFVGAFVVACVVFGSVDYARKKKEGKTAAAPETEAAETENEKE